MEVVEPGNKRMVEYIDSFNVVSQWILPPFKQSMVSTF